MGSGDHRHELRLAFSYREKAKAQLATLERQRAAGAVDPVRYSTLLEYYSQHVVDAETLANRMAAPDRKRLADLQEKLGALQREQFELRQAAASGRLHPHEANEENRRLAEQADALRVSLVEAQHIADGDRVALGDFIDRPLDQYARELQSVRTPTPAPRRKTPRPHTPPPAAAPPRVPPILFAMGVGLAAAAAGAFILFVVFGGRPALTMTVEGDDQAPTLQITLANSGDSAATVYVPAPEGEPVDGAYAILLLVHEKGIARYSVVGGLEDAWREGGFPMTGRNPMDISPGLYNRFSFNVKALRQFNADADRIRFELRGPSGAVLMKQERALQP